MLDGADKQPDQLPRDTGTVCSNSESDRLTVRFSGRWDVRTVIATERQISDVQPIAGKASNIDISGVTVLDTVGAITIARLEARLATSGKVDVTGANDQQTRLLELVTRLGADTPPAPPKPNFIDWVARIGARTVRVGLEARTLTGFYGELIVVFIGLLRHPKRIRLTAMVSQMQAVGLDAMPIVGMLAFLVGVVLTFISGDQLQRFGAGIFIVNLIGIGVLRELGILITAIIIAGRSGSAFTAEIGTMKINQEVDAMRTIGLDPMEVLVIPRTVALMLILFPLNFFANMVMIGGGALMADLSLGVTFPQFVNQFHAAVPLMNFWVGMIKVPFFAFVIAMVGCFHGLEVTGSAESVGQHTTQSVVQSIFLVITLDAIFAVVFSQLGW